MTVQFIYSEPVELTSLKAGCNAKIRHLDFTGPALHKFLQFGFVPGSSIVVLHKYYSNFIVKLDNMKLVIDKKMAQRILVSAA